MMASDPEADQCRFKMSIAARDDWTDQQGQYLAFIYGYTKIHRRAPAEADMERFFQVTPPSVHRTVLELERRGLTRRTAGVARSIELLVPVERLPVLR